MTPQPVLGLPGIKSDRTATMRKVRKSDQGALYIESGRIIDGSKARDTLNTGDLDVLRAGLLMGKITSGGKYAPAVLGTLDNAYDSSADTTLMTVTPATAVEIVRRIGTTGTFKLTGPPSAAGTVQTVTVTYSAVNQSTGALTITALTVDVDEVQTITPTVGANVDCVQTITLGGTSTAGTMKIGIMELGDPNGAILWTDTIAWSATEATMTSSVNTALDNLLGAGIVVCSAIPDTDTPVLTLTFSGAGATNREHGFVAVDISALTGASTASVAMTTKGSGTISAGTYTIEIVDLNGDIKVTPEIAFDANAAAIITALDDALGAGLVVATGGPLSGPTAIVLTFSGAGYAALAQTKARLNTAGIAGLDDLTITVTTAATTLTSNDFVDLSLVQPTDGSETPICLVDDGWGMKVTDLDSVNIDVPFPMPLVGGSLDSSQIVYWPTDASLISWVKDQLNSRSGSNFVFDDAF